MVQQVVEEILSRELKPESPLPRAFLIGREPGKKLGYSYVRQGDHEAVVIGSLSPWELLQFPNEVCTEAMVKGKPVLLWQEGLDYRQHRASCNRSLYARLLAAERQLKQLGVQIVGQEERTLLTAQEVRRRLRTGEPIEGRLTPLAREILESEGRKGSP